MAKLSFDAGLHTIFWVVSIIFFITMVSDVIGNKELYYTTPCLLEDESAVIDISELYKYEASEVWGEVGELTTPNEVDRLKQSCLAWQHNRNVYAQLLLPYTLFLLFGSIVKMHATPIKKALKRLPKAIRETKEL